MLGLGREKREEKGFLLYIFHDILFFLTGPSSLEEFERFKEGAISVIKKKVCKGASTVVTSIISDRTKHLMWIPVEVGQLYSSKNLIKFIDHRLWCISTHVKVRSDLNSHNRYDLLVDVIYDLIFRLHVYHKIFV